jgi:hypothetical protein
MMGVWLLLLIPSLLWWKESLVWIVAMSWYANFGTHFSAYQASRSEKVVQDQQTNS